MHPDARKIIGELGSGKDDGTRDRRLDLALGIAEMSGLHGLQRGNAARRNAIGRKPFKARARQCFKLLNG
jgi:hypothetical protein